MRAVTALELVAELRRRGVTLEARGDRLRFKPASAVPPALREALKANKRAVLDELRRPGVDFDSAPILEARHRPVTAVLIEPERFGQAWIVLSEDVAGELRAEEAQRDPPRPVLRAADIIALRDKPEGAIRAVFEAAKAFPGAKVVQ